jgi:hypothetical protein
MRRTPKPVIDIAEVIPEMARLARTTVRLHPRRGVSARDASKMGSPIVWPSDEPWPVCSEHHSALVPVLQLRRQDVPEFAFRGDTDLFQLLWCPNDHETLEPLMLRHRELLAKARQHSPRIRRRSVAGSLDEGLSA